MNKLLFLIFFSLCSAWAMAQTGSTKKKTTSSLFESTDKTVYEYKTDEEYIEKAKNDITLSMSSGELGLYAKEQGINTGTLNLKIMIGAKNRITGIFVEQNEDLTPNQSNSFKDFLQYNAKFNFKLPKEKSIKFNYIFNFK